MTWRERLDARVSRCPGCDEWCWDRECRACAFPVENPEPHSDMRPEAA